MEMNYTDKWMLNCVIHQLAKYKKLCKGKGIDSKKNEPVLLISSYGSYIVGVKKPFKH